MDQRSSLLKFQWFGLEMAHCAIYTKPTIISPPFWCNRELRRMSSQGNAAAGSELPLSFGSTNHQYEDTELVAREQEMIQRRRLERKLLKQQRKAEARARKEARAADSAKRRKVEVHERRARQQAQSVLRAGSCGPEERLFPPIPKVLLCQWQWLIDTRANVKVVLSHSRFE